MDKIEELEMRIAAMESAIYTLADSLETRHQTLIEMFRHAEKPHMSAAAKEYREWAKNRQSGSPRDLSQRPRTDE